MRKEHSSEFSHKILIEFSIINLMGKFIMLDVLKSNYLYQILTL